MVNLDLQRYLALSGSWIRKKPVSPFLIKRPQDFSASAVIGPSFTAGLRGTNMMIQSRLRGFSMSWLYPFASYKRLKPNNKNPRKRDWDCHWFTTVTRHQCRVYDRCRGQSPVNRAIGIPSSPNKKRINRNREYLLE